MDFHYFCVMEMLKKIRELRKNKGYSQKNMAEKLNLSISGYAKIENGENFLSVERFLYICRILEVKSYNQILPAINVDAATEIEKVVLSGGMAFESIHRNSMYVLKLIDNLCDNVKGKKQVDNETLLKELELIESYLQIISGESTKHGYNFLSLKNLLDSID